MTDNNQAARVRRQMTVSLAGSFFFGQIATAGSVYMTSYILWLGGTTQDIGRLAGIPQLTGLLQLFSVLIYRRFRSRKRVVVGMGILKYVLFYSIFLIPWLPQSIRMTGLMVMLTSGFAVQALTGAGVTEWNDFFVPSDMKGRFYSNRNLLNNLTGALVALFVGQMLTWLGETSLAFMLILAVSLVFSTAEILTLLPVPDVCEGLDVPGESRLRLMMEPLTDRRYRHYMIFTALWTFGLLLGQPYQNYFALRELNLAVAGVTGVASAVAAAKLVSAKLWGAGVDRFGGRRMLTFTGFFYAASGAFWCLLPQGNLAAYAILIFLTGLVMIGTNIAIFNLNIVLSPVSSRVSYFGVNAAVTGVAGYLAPLVGTWMMHLSGGKGAYQLVFATGAAVQVLALMIYFIRKPAEK